MNTLAILKDHGVPVSLGGKNVGHGWIGVNCPYCGDSSFHGGFPGSGIPAFTCFKCGEHPFRETLKLLMDVDWGEFNQIMDQYIDPDIYAKVERKEAKASSIVLPGDEALNVIAITYLKKRRFDPVYLQQKYHIRATGMESKFKYRIIIPIYFDGQLVSFTGRDYTGQQEERYKTLQIEESVVNAKHVLYNEQFVRGDRIMVVEGPTDAWRLGNGAVATLGTKVSEQQVRKIAQYQNKFLVFDPEPEAQERARVLAQRISALSGSVSIIDTELDHDPGDMIDAEVRELRKALDFV